MIRDGKGNATISSDANFARFINRGTRPLVSFSLYLSALFRLLLLLLLPLLMLP